MNKVLKKINVLFAILTDNHQFGDWVLKATKDAGVHLPKGRLKSFRVGETNPSYQDLSLRELLQILDAMIARAKVEHQD